MSHTVLSHTRCQLIFALNSMLAWLMKTRFMIELIEKWSYDYIKMDCEDGKCYGVLAVSALSWVVEFGFIAIANRSTVFASPLYYSMSSSVSHLSAFATLVTREQPSKMGKGLVLLVWVFVHIVVAGGARRFYSGLCLSPYLSSFQMASLYSGEATSLLSVPPSLSFSAWFSWWTLPTHGPRLVSRTGRIPTTLTCGNGSSWVPQPACMRQHLL